MLVDLQTLKPNPMRDFIVDPIDRETVETLKASIHEHGFWGGIACRQLVDGTIEIAAGHHRVYAAVDAGVETADVFVRQDIDNREMVRLYAKENATQRANTSSTALAGSIASAVHFLAKTVITGGSQKFLRTSELPEIQGNLQSGRGLGRDTILDFFKGVPGINGGIVDQQLANLKSSGDYARILADVEQEIAVDHAMVLQQLAEQEATAEQARQDEEAKQVRAARVEAEATQAKVKERAKQATAKAAETPITFDFEGVSKHLKNAHQLTVFRKLVTTPEMLQSLAVNEQADVAQHLVEHAKAEDVELTGRFLREELHGMIVRSKNKARQLSRREQALWHQKDLESRAGLAQDNFMRSVYSLESSAMQLLEFLRKEWPQETAFPWKLVLRKEFAKTKKVIDELAAKL